MGNALFVILLASIFFTLELSLSKGSIVINNNLRISSEDLTLFGDDEWVDLNHITVSFNETIEDMFKHEYYLALVFLNT